MTDQLRHLDGEPAPHTGEHAASFYALAEAFQRAAGEGASGAALQRALQDLQDEIGATPATWAIECLVGLVATKKAETPRAVLAAELASAPGDEYWNPALPGPRRRWESWRARVRLRPRAGVRGGA